MLMSGGMSCIPGVVAGGLWGLSLRCIVFQVASANIQLLLFSTLVLLESGSVDQNSLDPKLLCRTLLSCQADLAALEMRCQQRISSESINLTADLEAEVQSGAEPSFWWVE